MTTKQLRHCSAHVNINEGMFCNSYELVSYRTPVALLGMIDDTIVDDNGVEHEHHGMALLLGEDYDCSTTTMMHVRKFCKDYVGVSATIADLRKALASNGTIGYGVAVYRASWA